MQLLRLSNFNQSFKDLQTEEIGWRVYRMGKSLLGGWDVVVGMKEALGERQFFGINGSLHFPKGGDFLLGL